MNYLSLIGSIWKKHIILKYPRTSGFRIQVDPWRPLCQMPIPLKGKIYKTVVCPVALYGTASWPATTKHEQTLRGMEMKMLCWSLGPHATQPRYEWRCLKVHGCGAHSRQDARSPTPIRSSDDRVVKMAYHRWPKKQWLDHQAEDIAHSQYCPDNALDWAKWRKACKQWILH